MQSHGYGAVGARQLATGEWGDLLVGLAGSGYGQGLAPTADRIDVSRRCTEAVVWNLRVLAGWLPSGSLAMLRALVGQFEIDNIERHLRQLETGSAAPQVELGALAVAWPRVRACSTPEEVRDVLRVSSWADPGGTDSVAVAVGLNISWARRLRRLVPGATDWGLGAAALVVAREQFVFGRDLNAIAAREVDLLVGRRWRSASTLDEFLEALGPGARWVFAGVSAASDLWRAERDWWIRVETDAASMMDPPRPNAEAVVGAVALMLVDLRRVKAAIETVGRGPTAVEVFDDVA